MRSDSFEQSQYFVQLRKTHLEFMRAKYNKNSNEWTVPVRNFENLTLLSFASQNFGGLRIVSHYIPTILKRLRFEIGAVSVIATLSPSFAVFPASCTRYFFERR